MKKPDFFSLIENTPGSQDRRSAVCVACALRLRQAKLLPPWCTQSPYVYPYEFPRLPNVRAGGLRELTFHTSQALKIRENSICS